MHLLWSHRIREKTPPGLATVCVVGHSDGRAEPPSEPLLSERLPGQLLVPRIRGQQRVQRAQASFTVPG
jgi:hypothetical protein